VAGIAFFPDHSLVKFISDPRFHYFIFETCWITVLIDELY